VDELAAEVASASSEQSQGITQINTAVSQMDRVTQSNAANAEESASAAQVLHAQAADLRHHVTALLELVNCSRPSAAAESGSTDADAAAAPAPQSGARPSLHQPSPSTVRRAKTAHIDEDGFTRFGLHEEPVESKLP
jgi:hypothetical protein